MSINLPTSQVVEEVLREARHVDDGKLRLALDKPRLFVGLDHWQLWLLICLSRHVARQKWVGFVVESRLRGELDKIGSIGAFGHPEELEQHGTVPDFPEWKYFFHGSGCCLTHVDGTEIDVDFTQEGQSTRIDPYFYSNFLESLKSPELPEQILKRPACLRNYWQEDLTELQRLGCWDDRQVTDLGLQIHEVFTPIVEHLSSLAGRSDGNDIRQTLYFARVSLL